jgi:hypothetical protein
MQKALGLFDALLIGPLFSVTLTLISILTGAIYFNEIAGFTVTQAILFPVGVFITLCGVFLLSQREMGGTYRFLMLLVIVLVGYFSCMTIL